MDILDVKIDLKKLLKLAVTNVFINAKTDGLCNGSINCSNSDNIWIKSFHYQIKSTKKIINKIPKASIFCIAYHMTLMDNLRSEFFCITCMSVTDNLN